MWKGVNIVGIPVKIIHNKKELVVPFDHKVYEFTDDEAFLKFKSLFKIVAEPDISFFKKKENLKKPLNGVRIKKHRMKLKNKSSKYVNFQENFSYIQSKNRDYSKKYTWTFISPRGDIRENVKLTEIAKEMGVDYRTFYTYANKKKYKGWTITKKEIEE